MDELAKTNGSLNWLGLRQSGSQGLLLEAVTVKVSDRKTSLLWINRLVSLMLSIDTPSELELVATGRKGG